MDRFRPGFTSIDHVDGATTAPGDDHSLTLAVEILPLSPVPVELSGEGTPVGVDTL